MNKEIKLEIKIQSGNSYLEGGVKDFTLSVRSDPQQHGKTLDFNYYEAQGLKDILDEYIKMRETVSNENNTHKNNKDAKR